MPAQAKRERTKDMHAKQRMIPWGHIAAMALLALAVAGILLGLSIVTATQSGAATTGYLRPAVTAARTVDHGYTGNADRVTQWQHVLKHCKKVGCVSQVRPALKRAMGIPAGHAYRVHWGDTTFAWVRMAGGTVETITS